VGSNPTLSASLIRKNMLLLKSLLVLLELNWARFGTITAGINPAFSDRDVTLVSAASACVRLRSLRARAVSCGLILQKFIEPENRRFAFLLRNLINRSAMPDCISDLRQLAKSFLK